MRRDRSWFRCGHDDDPHRLCDLYVDGNKNSPSVVVGRVIIRVSKNSIVDFFVQFP